MLPAHEIALSADDCRIVRQGLERLIAHWHDHPAAAAACIPRFGTRGLIIPKEAAHGD